MIRRWHHLVGAEGKYLEINGCDSDRVKVTSMALCTRPILPIPSAVAPPPGWRSIAGLTGGVREYRFVKLCLHAAKLDILHQQH